MSEPHEDRGLSRDQLTVLASLAALFVLSWLYLVQLAGHLPVMQGASADSMNGMSMPGMAKGPSAPQPSGTGPFALGALMWFAMMLGMMLPSAAPMLMLYAHVQRRRAGASPLPRTALFGLGYLVVWAGFSLAAAALQEALARAALLTPGITLASTLIGGATLVAAGLYELTPLKQSCLAHCRGPVAFIASHWRTGASGAVRMGLDHGLYCLGCCWALMLLLFVGGVMNLLWIAALAGLVLVQKLLPAGRVITWLTSGALVTAGLVLLSSPAWR